jgi:hypothetical protein
MDSRVSVGCVVPTVALLSPYYRPTKTNSPQTAAPARLHAASLDTRSAPLLTGAAGLWIVDIYCYSLWASKKKTTHDRWTSSPVVPGFDPRRLYPQRGEQGHVFRQRRARAWRANLPETSQLPGWGDLCGGIAAALFREELVQRREGGADPAGPAK